MEKKKDLSVALSAQRRSNKTVSSEPAPSMDHEEHYSSIADAILAKSKKAKMMADGGMVDLDENQDEAPIDFDLEVAEPFGDDIEDSKDQPMDSNEHGDKLSDADKNDKIDMIRRKVMAKRK